MMNSMLIYLFLLSFVLVTFSINPGSNSVQHKELSKEHTGLRWLTDIITWIPWLLRSILSFIYLIINTVVLTLTYFVATMFSLLHQFIKLIEFLGYLVRLVLQANYNFVSSFVTRMRFIVQNSYVFLRDLLVSTARTFLSLIKTVVNFLHHIVFNMPKLFEFTETGLRTTAKMAGSVTQKTNSTFRTIVSVIKAVVELFGTSILNTFKVVIDLLYTGILSCVHFFQFVGKNIISLTFRISQSMIHLFQRIWAAIKTCCSIIFAYAKSSYYGVLQFIQAIFSMFCDVIMSILKTIGLFVRHFGRFALNTFIALGRFVNYMARNITDIGTQLIPSIKASKVLVISMSCMLLIVISITMVLKINIFILVFGFLESLIQYVSLLMIRSVNNQQTVIDNSRQSSNFTPGNEERLQRQLELERDKTLCVVCQDEVKKILLLPCRHMCICVMCANHITSIVNWNRRVCPLCRTRIGSMVEVYS
ncbi:uncharacterized protein LOC116296485 [Actinia tenebrosa]|uniref:Uncharacterized protein LOC116296485 n=1 Tax=Actinia tenebrosa TaxID=6105 RepID=A0A6P8HYB2_ACTTE|nr:uncharacterized protein LOC116296485 [Actinia tenebrosa]